MADLPCRALLLVLGGTLSIALESGYTSAIQPLDSNTRHQHLQDIHRGTASPAPSTDGLSYQSLREATLTFDPEQLQANNRPVKYSSRFRLDQPAVSDESDLAEFDGDHRGGEDLQASQPPFCDNDRETEATPESHGLNEWALVRAEGAGVFHCPPCNCSYTNTGSLIANCSHQQLFVFPVQLPADLYRLYMDDTALGQLDTVPLLGYQQLGEIYVNNNKQLRTIVSLAAGYPNSTITLMDLSFNRIQSIDNGSFTSMAQLQRLSLKNNRLHRITNTTFAGLALLKALDLAVNKITHIEPGAFDDLVKLKTLDLSSNPHLGYRLKDLPPRLFQPLQRLQNLVLIGSSSTYDREYPEHSLQQLSNLRTLVIDGMNEDFGTGMKSLKHWSGLQLGRQDGKVFCKLKQLTSTFFDNLPYIESLVLEMCPLWQVNTAAYYKAPHLKNLTISHMHNYDLLTAFNDLEGLQNSSLKYLSLVRLYHSVPPCRYLYGAQAKYLMNIQLLELDLSENRLAFVGNDFIHGLPATLTSLVLQKNRLIEVNNLLNELSFLNNLVLLDLSEQIDYWDPLFINNFTTNNVSCSEKVKDNEKAMLPASTIEPEFGEEFAFSATNSEGVGLFAPGIEVSPEGIQQLQLTTPPHRGMLPPNLKYLKASHFFLFGRWVFRKRHHDHTKLKYLDISNNFLSKLSPSDHMTSHVEVADLSGNYLSEIHPHFFRPNNTLAHLSLRNNALSAQLSDDVNGTVFRHLNRLFFLDITLNSVFRLLPNVFKGLTSLKALVMAENKLQYLCIDFSQMPSLSFLDLSKNSIMWITRKSRDDLDAIAASHPLVVDLTLNPLPCTCQGLNILQWMATTKVTFQNQEFLTCRLDTGDIAYIGDLWHRLRLLQRQCGGRGEILAIGSASALLFVFLLTFTMMYRYRWKLRYLRNVALARLAGYKPRAARELGVKYDAYVLYSEDARVFVLKDCRQELEVKRGHKLCLAERDFMPGTVEASAVVSAVHYSKKTIAVITPDFCQDEMSEYGIKMAINEEAFQKRSILHLCIYRPMSTEQMQENHDLLMVMKRNDYTECPPEDQTSEEVRRDFWDQLSQVIAHSVQDIMEVEVVSQE